MAVLVKVQIMKHLNAETPLVFSQSIIKPVFKSSVLFLPNPFKHPIRRQNAKRIDHSNNRPILSQLAFDVCKVNFPIFWSSAGKHDQKDVAADYEEKFSVVRACSHSVLVRVFHPL